MRHVTKAPPCYACDNGTVHPKNVRGRRFDYRDELALVFDQDLEVPTCNSCGELYMTGELTKRFGEALERIRSAHKQGAVKRFVETIEREFPTIPKAVWEDTFGISRGYLSRLASGARVADTALEILLAGFAKEPTTALRLVKAAGHLPRQLASLVTDADVRQRRRTTPA
jgi:hypothetical protein